MWIRSGNVVGVRKAIATATESYTLLNSRRMHVRTYTPFTVHQQPLSLCFSHVSASAHTIPPLERFVDLVYRTCIPVARKHFAGLLYDRNRERELTRK